MNRLFAILKGVLFAPEAFYKSHRQELIQQSIGSSIPFILVMVVVGKLFGVLVSIMHFRLPFGGVLSFFLMGLITGCLMSIAGALIGAGLFWMIAHCFGSQTSYQAAFAVTGTLTAFVPIQSLVAYISLMLWSPGASVWLTMGMSMLVTLWSCRSIGFGMIHVLDVPAKAAWSVCAIIVVLLLVQMGYIGSRISVVPPNFTR